MYNLQRVKEYLENWALLQENILGSFLTCDQNYRLVSRIVSNDHPFNTHSIELKIGKIWTDHPETYSIVALILYKTPIHIENKIYFKNFTWFLGTVPKSQYCQHCQNPTPRILQDQSFSSSSFSVTLRVPPFYLVVS